MKSTALAILLAFTAAPGYAFGLDLDAVEVEVYNAVPEKIQIGDIRIERAEGMEVPPEFSSENDKEPVFAAFKRFFAKMNKKYFVRGSVAFTKVAKLEATLRKETGKAPAEALEQIERDPRLLSKYGNLVADIRMSQKMDRPVIQVQFFDKTGSILDTSTIAIPASNIVGGKFASFPAAFKPTNQSSVKRVVLVFTTPFDANAIDLSRAIGLKLTRGPSK